MDALFHVLFARLRKLYHRTLHRFGVYPPECEWGCKLSRRNPNNCDDQATIRYHMNERWHYVCWSHLDSFTRSVSEFVEEHNLQHYRSETGEWWPVSKPEAKADVWDAHTDPIQERFEEAGVDRSVVGEAIEDVREGEDDA